MMISGTNSQVPEDQQITDFVMSQCNMDFLDENCDYTSKNNQQHATELELINNPWNISSSNHQNNFQWDPSLPDQYASPLNLFDGAIGTQPADLDSTIDNGAAAYHEQSMMMMQESAVVGQEKESVKQETAGRADSGSEGSEDDEDARPVGRNGKKHHSKNLMAERKRRKKLNDRLYALRALVPKITKMDRASILGDAIEYVMELQKQVKDLQDELENDTHPEEAEAKQIESNYEMETTNPTELMISGNGMELDESRSGAAINANKTSADSMKQGVSSNEEKGNQMEPQVEVKQLEANEFYLKVFCEHKVGGFTRLMEAISSLGLEVTNASVTTLQTLVLNVFRVQKRENEMVQVDQVRDSLLELTRGPIGNWPEPAYVAVNNGDCQHDNCHHHRRNHHDHHLSSNRHLHFLHHQP